MKLTFDEKKLLYAYGNPDLALTRKRLYEVAGLTVDPDLNRLVFDFVRKLENESLHAGALVRPDVLLHPFRDGVLCQDGEAGAGHRA
mgnify:CR=1 FL=1